jgi:endonuclease YncB( thermonuclease family)
MSAYKRPRGRHTHLRTTLLAFALWSLTVWADVLEGRVVGVADGGTITLLDGNRQQHGIRLAGIDAPEKAQPFGLRSKQHLSKNSFVKKCTKDAAAPK